MNKTQFKRKGIFENDKAFSGWVLFIIASVVLNNCMHSNKEQPATEQKIAITEEKETVVEEAVIEEAAIEPIAEAEEAVAENRRKKIYMLDGKVRLQMWDDNNVQLDDEKYNWGSGTSFSLIEKRGNSYFIYHLQKKEYDNMKDAITAFLQNLFEHFYEGRGDKERGKKAWEEFLKKDGPQLCMNYVNKTEIQPAERRTRIISVLGGDIKLELKEGDDDFPCIGMQFSDKSLNMVLGTYMEIKKRGNFYLMREYNGKKYSKMKDGITYELQELFKSFYERRGDKERGKKAWKAFVEEGGLQEFIDFANEIIDDNFLYSPFNDKYG